MNTSRTGHVLIAPDKFKGSLTAAEVAEHVARGLGKAAPEVPVQLLPVADGGDGTVAAALVAGFRAVHTEVLGPTGEPVEATFAIDEATALIEVAEACGMRRLPGGTTAPLTASSYGVGQLIRAALDAGARRIVLGLGGSACTDGGAGMVQALGGGLLDADRAPLPAGGATLAGLDRLELSTVAPQLAGLEVILASDVDNPLLGLSGAAAVYGPQKGASSSEVVTLDTALARWADVVEARLGHSVREAPGAGAAGGIGFAALAFLHARRRSGVDVLLDLIGFDTAVRGARLVVTGEGSLDTQTLHGKAPAGVALAANRAGVPVVAVAGRCTLDTATLHRAGIAAVYPLSDIEPDLEQCLRHAGSLLEQATHRLGLDWLEAPDDSV